MNKNVFNKVFGGLVLASSDLTPSEKVLLHDLMSRAGSTRAFSYDRFFAKGFSSWEIDGVWKAEIDYMQQLHTQEKIDIEVLCPSADAPMCDSRGTVCKKCVFSYVSYHGDRRSFDLLEKGAFWRFLGDIHRRHHFTEYMKDRGMLSPSTVRKRFSEDDFKGYEFKGVRQIVEEFCEQVKGSQDGKKAR